MAARQIVEGVANQDAPKYLILDRDGIYGHAFRLQLQALAIKGSEDRAPESLANGFVERLIGSIRRESWITL